MFSQPLKAPFLKSAFPEDVLVVTEFWQACHSQQQSWSISGKNESVKGACETRDIGPRKTDVLFSAKTSDMNVFTLTLRRKEEESRQTYTNNATRRADAASPRSRTTSPRNHDEITGFPRPSWTSADQNAICVTVRLRIEGGSSGGGIRRGRGEEELG
jgi:hypothetical protein